MKRSIRKIGRFDLASRQVRGHSRIEAMAFLRKLICIGIRSQKSTVGRSHHLVELDYGYGLECAWQVDKKTKSSESRPLIMCYVHKELLSRNARE
eukprot:IDg3337t1